MTCWTIQFWRARFILIRQTAPNQLSDSIKNKSSVKPSSPKGILNFTPRKQDSGKSRLLACVSNSALCLMKKPRSRRPLPNASSFFSMASVQICVRRFMAKISASHKQTCSNAIVKNNSKSFACRLSFIWSSKRQQQCGLGRRTNKMQNLVSVGGRGYHDAKFRPRRSSHRSWHARCYNLLSSKWRV